jgi:hypothetical protein
MGDKRPNPKHQAPEKFQAPNINPRTFAAWKLVLLWSLDIGAWSFVPFILPLRLRSLVFNSRQ